MENSRSWANTWAKPLVLRGLVLIGIVVFMILIINTSIFDEALDAEVEKIMATPPPVSLDGNAYTLLTGLTAASDKDPVTVGKLIVGEYRRLAEAGETISIEEEKLSRLLGGNDLDASWREQYDSLSCNPRRELGCLAELEKEHKNKARGNERLNTMLYRYKKIIELQNFTEINAQDFSSQLPPYNVLMNVSKLYLVNEKSNGDFQSILSALEKDMALWKLLLRDGKSLIAKMVGIAGIWSDLQMISELTAEKDLNTEQIAALRQLLQPLTAAEHDIGETFIAEFRHVLSMKAFHFSINQMSGLKKLLINSTHQENATLNEYYLTFIEPMMKLSQGNAKDFFTDTETSSENTPRYRLFPPTIYNLGGKILIYETHYEAKDYVSRTHDLTGVIALVNLQLDLEEKKGSSIVDVLKNSSYRNPYTGKGMEYNQDKNSLYFDCVSPGNLCEILL